MITEEQLNKVNQFLASAKLTDDYILEFKDHILCEIEMEMESGIAFETAFENVKEKWAAFLTLKTNWFLGLANMLPAIMIKKIVHVSLQSTIYSALITTLIIAPYFMFRNDILESTNILIRIVVLLIMGVNCAYFTYKFRFNNHKHFTSIYSSLLRSKTYMPLMFSLMYVVLFGVLSNLDRLEQINFETLLYSAFVITGDASKVNVLFLSFYVFFTISNFRYYFLHQRLVNKLTMAQ